MIKILIGLAALGVIVFFHELGHFFAAKLCGVDVESFSIGWGPVLFRKKAGKTEFRISAIPLGGYCGMKGEKAFQEAMEKNLSYIPKDAGSFYAASPFKRIIIAFAGPFANYLMAVAALAVVAGIGTSYYTTSNKIVPSYLYDGGADSPAKQAGLQTGDKIIEIDGKAVNNFYEIVQAVLPAAQQELTVKIDRNGTILTKKITPKLDKKTGAGVIGFYSFVPLELDSVQPNSPAEAAGFQKGDIIIKINGEQTANTIDLQNVLKPDGQTEDEFTILRNGQELTVAIKIVNTAAGSDLGLILKTEKVQIPGKGFFGSILEGFISTHKTFALTFKSLSLMFKGVDVKEAISGPLRITHMIGETAERGFQESFFDGISGLLGFVSIICVSLFIMNLLPVPILDGGLILFSLLELLFRKEIRPKVLYYVQFIGIAFIALVFIFTMWSDIRFLIKAPH